VETYSATVWIDRANHPGRSTAAPSGCRGSAFRTSSCAVPRSRVPSRLGGAAPGGAGS